MRAIINVSDQQIVVAYDGVARKGNLSGVVADVSWNNPAVMEGLRHVFACKQNEEIIAVRLHKDGVMVEIKVNSR